MRDERRQVMSGGASPQDGFADVSATPYFRLYATCSTQDLRVPTFARLSPIGSGSTHPTAGLAGATVAFHATERNAAAVEGLVAAATASIPVPRARCIPTGPPSNRSGAPTDHSSGWILPTSSKTEASHRHRPRRCSCRFRLHYSGQPHEPVVAVSRIPVAPHESFRTREAAIRRVSHGP